MELKVANNYISNATKGAISELKVEIDLLSKGYHVFRSESPACPCDIIAVRDNICIKIEVRTIKSRDNHGCIPKAAYHEYEGDFIDWWAFVLPDEIVYEICKKSRPKESL